MGVLDKIKNALFEVEYVEVEEPETKTKKNKSKSKEKVKERSDTDKPIAKKVVLPGKKEVKVEELEEEELRDDNFEARPIDETIKESTHDDFKFMDDNDFRVEDEYENDVPEILEVIENNENERVEKKDRVERRRDVRQRHDDYSDRSYSDKKKSDTSSYEYVSEHPDKFYNKQNSKLYGMDKSYNVSVHEYGTYEKKEEKGYFKPSPIISPIYGILDKNYKKEDVVPKKEIRLTTSFTRSNVSVDDIRNKAYGEKHTELDEVSETTFEVDDDEDENLLVDLSSDSLKPEVKEVTMGDALEYFQDLGLEYNVDYVDATKERATPRRVRDNYDDVVITSSDDLDEESTSDVTPILKEIVEDDTEEEEPKTKNIVEVKDESQGDEKVSLDDDDNLFDLIDSMYQEED